MRKEIEDRVRVHGNHLIELFKLPADTDPIALCRKLRRIEVRAHKAATDWCNGDLTELAWEAFELETLDRVEALLFRDREPDVPVFLNGDARGYALKVDDGWLSRNPHQIHRDWGGYGILAPDLTEA